MKNIKGVLKSNNYAKSRKKNRHKSESDDTCDTNQIVLKRLSKKDDELRILHGELRDKTARLSKKDDELRILHGELRDKTARLSKKDDELRILHGELRDKTARLASGFEKRLKQDQRRVENTVEFNTPTDVEKDFMDFFDGERIDACDVMETTLKPEEEIELDLYYPRLACIIFVTAYEQVKESREAACDLFENVTRQLIDETPKLSQELCLKRKEGGYSAHFPITFDVSVAKKNQEISTDVVDGLMLCLKQTAHLCNLDFFENDVKEIVWEHWQKYLHEDGKPLLPALSQDVLIELSDYIRACIRLTWRMVTQMPPLQLEYKSIKFDKDIHKLTRSQCNTEIQSL
ncbi:hypothetical protein OS493_032637 [Desmophyllum pertusum]|uniref:Mitochondria-eating protein n=1 Tax=Desmophyllum pertusum TaxID=174260 RepID=A0A9W9YJ85_9CNID|nr:hypothetical protein OS493_032637 [Desmophyllum pertusum]